ncbi:MAG: polymorphic toxin-type HINT domain-containing protein [Nostoc sp.]|uniref:polymorphic toxin-type HINT domain-containing protein n=1 Tax=Nostoc sp. TaxID=1180 RepID=UPI002FF24073
MGAIIGGALAAGVFDTARQGYQLIDSAIHGDGRKTDFDVDELLQSVQIGAALGPLLAVVPEAALYFAYEGIKSGVAELEAGNIATGVFDILTSVIPLVEQAGSKGGSNCFVAGTKILTTEGEKNIEDIQVGDWVVSDDPNTPGEIEAHQVLDTFVRETTALVDLYVDGEVISTTGEHPFWTPDRGWVEAKNLQVGSLLQTEDGRVIDVDKIEKREGDFTVYNFKVEDFHTYFVSDLGILVHNADCFGTHLKQLKGDPPAGMPDPHAHHILYKKGRGAEQQKLVQEGQQLLTDVGIDPIWGPENLTWAPNRVTGQHRVQDARDIVDALKAVKASGGGRREMTKVLEQFGLKAAQRR